MKHKPAKSGNQTIEAQIGQRLTRFRQQCGLTHEDVDARLGARKGSMKMFEEGNRFVSPAHLIAFSRILKVDVASFFPDADTAIATLAPDPDAVASAKRMRRAYYDIQDPVLRRSVVDLLKEVAADKTFS